MKRVHERPYSGVEIRPYKTDTNKLFRVRAFSHVLVPGKAKSQLTCVFEKWTKTQKEAHSVARWLKDTYRLKQEPIVPRVRVAHG